MSKERELLRRVISGDDDGDFFISHRLYKDIETFLAQPEQEPEAWIIVNKETGYRTQVSDLTPFLYHREIFEVIPLYTATPKPEPTAEPVAWIIETEIHGKLSEWVCTDKKHYIEAHDGAKDPIPLYLAPPKREPLSDKEITKNTPKLIHIGERLAFHAGVRFAESHHSIGGGEC